MNIFYNIVLLCLFLIRNDFVEKIPYIVTDVENEKLPTIPSHDEIKAARGFWRAIFPKILACCTQRDY